MTAPHASDILNGYLARLEAEAADLPRTERRELIDGVHEHIAEARAEMRTETDAELLNLLDRLGDPAELAAEERERLGLREPAAVRVGLLEIGALILTPLIWPIGVILLWTSSAWNTRDKLIGTLVPPGGLFTSLLVLGITATARGQVCSGGYNRGHQIPTTCSGGLHGIGGLAGGILLLLVILSPILTGIYMGIRLRQRTRTGTLGALA
jgi:uncharacterized membrane protein